MAQMRSWAAAALVTWVSMDAPVVPPDQDGRRRTQVVGVVGRWVEDAVGGVPVIRGEGATEPVGEASARTLAESLFGRIEPAFVANVTTPGAFALSVIPHVATFQAGSYKAQFNLVSGASDQTAGLVFDLQPTGEYLYVRYNTRDGNVALWRYADGKRVRIADGELQKQLPLGAWHGIELTIIGTRLSAVVDGTLKLEHDLPRAPSGKVGFWTKRDSVTMFRQIDVQPR